MTDVTQVRTQLRRPRWLAPVSLLLAVLGLLDSIYLTFEHFTDGATLACSDTGTVDCLQVTTSSWSQIAGIPVAVLGLVYFVAMTVLCLPVVWRRGPAVLVPIRIVSSVVGLLMVFYLLWAEFFQIHAICLWCTGVHIITFLLLIVLVLGEIFTSVDLDA